MPCGAMKNPFPALITDAEEMDGECGGSCQEAVCASLRTSHAYWKRLVQHLQRPAVGSLAVELIVILDDNYVPHVLQDAADNQYVYACMRKVLHSKGVATRAAGRLASAVFRRVQVSNAATLEKCRTLTECTEDRILVLRVAIKSVLHVSVNPSTQKVWFLAGHANVMLLNTISKHLVLVEPTGRVVVRSLGQLLLFQTVHPSQRSYFRVLTNLEKRTSDGPPPPPDDNLCTIWAAVYGMMYLSNVVTTEAELWTLMDWVARRRLSILRFFLRHARAHLMAVEIVH